MFKTSKINIFSTFSIYDLNQEELRDWLALTHIYGIGAQTLLKLQEKLGYWRNVFNASKESLLHFGFSEAIVDNIKNPPWHEIDRVIAWQEQNTNHHILSLTNSDYPPFLREINYPPLVLYVIGDKSILKKPQLAMVGSRNPSCVGLETAQLFAQELSASGLVITSGLAIGIDSVCHKGALMENSKTIAVLGTGVDNIYPRRNIGLVEEIISQRGAIVSEFPLGTKARADHFPRRNRIISGLSLGTLVVEATQNSGSLITAQYALEQGRDVFAMPGSIHNPLARGCHKLLRQGAKLVERVSDVLEELEHLFTPIKSRESGSKNHPEINSIGKNALDYDSKKLLECIAYEATPVDVIKMRSKLPIAMLNAGLMNLELQGWVESVAGGFVRKLKLDSPCEDKTG